MKGNLTFGRYKYAPTYIYTYIHIYVCVYLCVYTYTYIPSLRYNMANDSFRHTKGLTTGLETKSMKTLFKDTNLECMHLENDPLR